MYSEFIFSGIRHLRKSDDKENCSLRMILIQMISNGKIKNISKRIFLETRFPHFCKSTKEKIMTHSVTINAIFERNHDFGFI